MSSTPIPPFARDVFQQEVVLEGDAKLEIAAGQLLLLMHGCAACADAQGKLLRIYWPGEIVTGEGQWLLALSLCQFRRATEADVVAALQADSGFGVWFLSRAAEAERRLQNRIDWFINLRAEDRILRVIADLMHRAVETTGVAAVPLSQAQIAQLAGATRETASMLLFRLRKSNLVTYQRRLIEAPEPEQLRQWARWPLPQPEPAATEAAHGSAH